MQCAETSALFIDHADQALPPQVRLALEAHLAGCPECAGLWRQYQQTVQLLHSLQQTKAPADLLAGIEARLDARRPLSQRLLELLDHLNFPIPLPAAVAAFAIAMFAGYLAQPPSQPGQKHPGPAAAVARWQAIPPMPPETRFAMAHAQQPSAPQLILTTHTGSSPTAPPQPPGERLLSFDLMIDIHHLPRPEQAQLCRELTGRRWRVRHSPHGLLVQLPAERLPELHALLNGHSFSIAPGEAARPGFGRDKPMLAALVHFH